MTVNNNDLLARAFAKLSSINTSIGNIPDVIIHEKYVREFHAVLEKLDLVGLTLNEFRVADEEIKPRIESSVVRYGVGPTEPAIKYSHEKYVDKTLLLIKVKAVLNYFEIIMS